jgi:cell division protein FtsB
MKKQVEELKQRIITLKTQIETLQDDKARLRAELLESRGSSLLFSSTLMDANEDEQKVPAGKPLTLNELQKKLGELSRENQRVLEESERKINKIKTKYLKLKTESSARIFELEEQLKGIYMRSPLVFLKEI